MDWFRDGGEGMSQVGVSFDPLLFEQAVREVVEVYRGLKEIEKSMVDPRYRQGRVRGMVERKERAILPLVERYGEEVRDRIMAEGCRRVGNGRD
jgi:hypothetical protein